MEETFDTIFPPPPKFAKRRSGLFINKTIIQPHAQHSSEESLAIKEYIKNLESEQKEFAHIWAKTKCIENREPPALDTSLLETDLLAFVKGGPDLKQFVDTLMSTTRQAQEFITKKNRLLKRQDLLLEKFNFILSNTVADIITEVELNS